MHFFSHSEPIVLVQRFELNSSSIDLVVDLHGDFNLPRSWLVLVVRLQKFVELCSDVFNRTDLEILAVELGNPDVLRGGNGKREVFLQKLEGRGFPLIRPAGKLDEKHNRMPRELPDVVLFDEQRLFGNKEKALRARAPED